MYIVETEAYTGDRDDDKAAHAFGKDTSKKTKTPLTTRKSTSAASKKKATDEGKFIAFHSPGKLYVYQIYGMYFCMNIIVEPEGHAGCVLIRGLRYVDTGVLLNGPGICCRELSMTKSSHNGVMLDQEESNSNDDNKSCWVAEGVKVQEDDIDVTKRIGITKSPDLPWRFVLKE